MLRRRRLPRRKLPRGTWSTGVTRQKTVRRDLAWIRTVPASRARSPPRSSPRPRSPGTARCRSRTRFRRRSAIGGVSGRCRVGPLAGTLFSVLFRTGASREGAKQSGQNAPRGAKLVDPMLAEDHDDRASGGSHDGGGVEGNTRAVTGRLVTGKIVRRPRVFDPPSFEGASISSYVGTSGRGFDSARGRTRVATRGVTFRSVQLSRGGWDDDELLDDEDGVPSGDLPVHVGNGTDRLANDDDDVPSSFGGFTAVGHGAGSPSPHALTLRRSVNHASVESSSHRQTQPPNPPRAGLPAMEPVCVTSNGDA